jgi:3-oxoacyl-(acyl-carrier-protein) synthase
MTDAGVEANDIDLAVPFGMGMVDRDATEMAGWNAAFGSRLAEIPALTTRGATGNCGAGAGAIDFVAATMAVYQRTVPPSINTDELDADCNFRFVNDGPVDAKITHAVTSTQALAGGQTAALVLKRFEE